MSLRHAFGLGFFAALTACQGSCSCGSSSDDDGSGGSGAATSTPTSSSDASNGSTSGGTGGGDGGGAPAGTGGAGQGGAGAAGQGGAGGAGGAEGGGGPGGGTPELRECEVAEDCQLVDDCCTCDAIPSTVTPEECLGECEQSACSALERSEDAAVACVAGRCVAGFDCNWALTTCDAAPPDCEDGFTASVIGGCYGPCVPTTECLGVASCEQCDGGLACVQQADFATSTHCVTDGSCPADDCECLGPSVCNENDACIVDESGALTCECINC